MDEVKVFSVVCVGSYGDVEDRIFFGDYVYFSIIGLSGIRGEGYLLDMAVSMKIRG